MLRLTCPECSNVIEIARPAAILTVTCDFCRKVLRVRPKVVDAEIIEDVPRPAPARGLSLAASLGIAGGVVLLAVVLLFVVTRPFASQTTTATAPSAPTPLRQPAPSPAPTTTRARPTDDLSLFVARYGEPDEEESTVDDVPRPPIPSRFLIYRKERVKALYLADVWFPGQGPPCKWKLIGFNDGTTTTPLDPEEVVRRMAKRDKGRQD
jgi:hypothetical protein